jgi:cytochrome c peroxidase
MRAPVRWTLLIFAATALLSGPAAAGDDLMSEAQKQFQPIPQAAPAIPGNPAAPEKIALGAMLYFDPRLSGSHAISCNSCHIVGLGGADGQETSIGHRWQRGGRNAPTVLNAIFNTAQFWDGRAKDLEAQAGGPIANPIEMSSPSGHAVEQLSGIPGYLPKFQAAFPEEPNPISLANAQKAIAVFEATLITPNAPFDAFLRGDAAALTAVQKKGLALFMDDGCSSCHNGINVGGGMYAPFGIIELPGADLLPPADKGRFAITRTVGDEYVFKVPTLRNIALTAPYFHSGRVWDLRQAVAVMGAKQIGIQLTDDEVTQITEFLQSLTGEQPKVVYPILPPSVAGTPRPQP